MPAWQHAAKQTVNWCAWEATKAVLAGTAIALVARVTACVFSNGQLEPSSFSGARQWPAASPRSPASYRLDRESAKRPTQHHCEA